MAVTFAPRRGAILMCDFDMACVAPEMNKIRPVLVISATGFNHRHGKAAGVCQIVPFTTKIPGTVGPHDIFIGKGSYWSLSEDSWVRCRMLCTVSHDRLDLVLRKGKRHPSEYLSANHMASVEAGIKLVLGIP